MNLRQQLALKVYGLLAGKKTRSYSVEGKTYFSLSDPQLANLLKSVDCNFDNNELIDLYYSIAEIYAPIDAVARRVAMSQWQVKKIKDDSVYYDSKELNALLTKPNMLQNWYQFMYESIVWEYVNGANYIYANCPGTLQFNYRNVATLQNLWTYNVEVLTDPAIKYLTATEQTDIIKGYRLAGYATIPTDRVLFSQYMSLDQNDKKVVGKSPLISASKAIANLKATYEARGSIYKNRGALGMFVSKKTDNTGNVPLTPKEKSEAKQDYLNAHGVTEGKDTIAISSLPMEWQRIAMTIAEMLPFEETQADAVAIYSVLNVPQDLMPTPKGSTYENQKSAERALYQNVIIPLAKSRAQSLTSFLKLEEAGLYIDATHDHIEVLQENRKDKAETYKLENESCHLLFTSGVITLNEWISKAGGKPSTNGLYNKRILEMSADEQATVLPLLNARTAPAAPVSK